jgi:hypothetical protein
LAAEEAEAAAARVVAEGEVAMARRALAVVREAQEPRICGRRVRAEDRLADLARDWAEDWELEGAPEAVRAREVGRVREVDPVQVLDQAPAQARVAALALVQAVRELAEVVPELLVAAVRESEVAVRDLVGEVPGPGVAVPASVAVQELATVRDLGLVAGSPEGGWRRPPRFEALHLQD